VFDKYLEIVEKYEEWPDVLPPTSFVSKYRRYQFTGEFRELTGLGDRGPVARQKGKTVLEAVKEMLVERRYPFPLPADSVQAARDELTNATPLELFDARYGGIDEFQPQSVHGQADDPGEVRRWLGGRNEGQVGVAFSHADFTPI
jgi:hypothetical protein